MALCYDATNLEHASDLRDKTDCFVIAALNKAVPTFDGMAHALRYHMFQPVIMTNCGQYGGSTGKYHKTLIVAETRILLILIPRSEAPRRAS